MLADYVVVGAGLTGATIARELSDRGREVIVIDRRSHIGGNVHDFVHHSGIRMNAFGPHYFRTSSEDIWAFVNRFARFYPFAATLKTMVDGELQDWPVHASYVESLLGKVWQPGFTGDPQNFEQASLAMMPRLIYEKFVENYTRKQWGVPPAQLDASLARRFEVRREDDRRLMQHKYQGLPVDGYAGLMNRMLEGIQVVLDFDYLKEPSIYRHRRQLIFTGSIDEFFDFRYGRLWYRTQRRTSEFLTEVDQFQPNIQVNNPDPKHGPHIRTIEWKHQMPPDDAKRIRGTLITRETPDWAAVGDDGEYPFPDAPNRALFERYRADLTDPHVLICGRLGEYRYYDMDQAIGRARLLASRILNDQGLAAE